jgi:hypothetical protein
MKTQLAFCKVNISPVRANNSDVAEMVTQLLFGEIFEVLEFEKSWCQILIYKDNYEGFIDVKHIELLSPKESTRWLDSQTLEANLLRQLRTPWGIQWITRGAFVGESNQDFIIGNHSFSFIDNLPNVVFNSISDLAIEFLNTPYLWGGKSPFGIDCSGFTQIVFRFFEINLPRDAYQQVELGLNVEFSEKLPGDLAFFTNNKGKVIHVGIILENNQIIHASGQVRIDNFIETGILNESKKEITHTLYAIKRV